MGDRRTRGPLAATLLLLALLAPASSTPVASLISAGAPVGVAPACGDTVGPGGTFFLKKNVGPCSTNPALTVDGATTLDMRKHSVKGSGTLGDGIHVINAGAVLKNGKVMNALKGVVVQGTGATITGITSSGNDGDGFDITGANNLLKRNSAKSNGDHGFHIDGNGSVLISNRSTNNVGPGYDTADGDQARLFSNRATSNDVGFVVDEPNGVYIGNTATKSASDGFVIREDNTRLIRNVATKNGDDGFDGEVGADNNFMYQNRSISNKDDGIILDETGWQFIGNTALKNVGIDLNDTSTAADCITNTWISNRFKTKSPACIT